MQGMLGGRVPFAKLSSSERHWSVDQEQAHSKIKETHSHASFRQSPRRARNATVGISHLSNISSCWTTPALPFTTLPVPLGHSADFNFTSSFCSAACALGTQKHEFQVERENHLISWTLLAYESSGKMMEWKEGREDTRVWLNRRQSVPTTKLKSQARFFFFGQKGTNYVLLFFFKYAWFFGHYAFLAILFERFTSLKCTTGNAVIKNVLLWI